MIKDEALQEYSILLQENGFAVYEPISLSVNFFVFSQMVDNRECFGMIQKSHFGGHDYLMPIEPSQESGAYMFVPKVSLDDGLSVKNARVVCQPTNWNDVVGERKNHWDTSNLKRFIKREAINYENR